MAPFTRGHCPGCSAETWQHFLPDATPDAAGGFSMICEGCQAVLICGEDWEVVGQRAATEQEREVIPVRPTCSKEQMARAQEDVQQGMAEIKAWIAAGCPGLTSEMVRHPTIAAALVKLGARLPPNG